MWVYRIVKRWYKGILTRVRRSAFQAGSVYGENVCFDESASCTNQTGHKENIQIGNNCMIRCQIIALGNGKITIGDNTYIGVNSRVGAIQNVTIGNNVIISSQVHILDNNNHPTAPEQRLQMTESADYFGELWSWTKSAHAPVHIQDNVWIGERCTILKGVSIGKGSIIGANAVVTRDIPDYVIAAGNPAKVVKHLSPKEGISHE